MSIEVCLHNLALRIRHLLGCNNVSLLLYCPEPTLRHSLLAPLPLFSARGINHCYGSLLPPELLRMEYISALCDMAIQTGQCVHFMAPHDACRDITTRQPTSSGSILAAPLERPAGVLGLLLCTDTRQDAFQYGACRLLEHYLPPVARYLEQVLADAWNTRDIWQLWKTPAQAVSLPASLDALQTPPVVRELCEFISMVSHELRLPLTTMKGYTALLQAYGFANEQSDEKVERNTLHQQRYLDTMMRQIHHLEVLIGDLLDMSRMQAGHMTLRCTKIDLVQLCQQIVQLTQVRLDQQPTQQCTLHCTIEPDLPQVWADPDRVQQVITNLLENAIKYSPDGGLIEIIVYAPCIHTSSTSYYPHTSQMAHCALQVSPTRELMSIYQKEQQVFSQHDAHVIAITVRDHGIGIPQEWQSSLFKPFTRLAHPTTRTVSGLGLGLYISCKLIEAMTGRVTLNSCEGRGTSVTFTLPIDPPVTAHSFPDSSENAPF